jgi:uncharacterized damage-inducible protein DinB
MIPELVHTFEATTEFLEHSVADLSESEMVEQPTGVPNHAAWTLGHVVHSFQGMAAELGAEPWLPPDWESEFGFGSTPHSDPRRYPDKSGLLTLLADATRRLRHAVLTADPALLEQALPDETLPTMRHLLLQVVVAHTAYHAGQLAVWRHALGKQSVDVFV